MTGPASGSPLREIPTQTDVVVVGGGIVGCSVAFHLARRGVAVVLLERAELTSGTTWHAAGLVPQLRATRQLTELARRSGELYERLEGETGQATGFVRNGSLAVAHRSERLEELLRGASRARALDVAVEPFDAAQVQEHWPLLETGDLLGGVYLPDDGMTNPVDTTQALARGARQAGALLVEEHEVTELLSDGRRIRGVAWRSGQTSGELRAERVIVCAGLWSRDLVGSLATVPLHAAEHFYCVTDAFEQQLTAQGRLLPTLRDPDARAYFKPETGNRLLIGFFEEHARPWPQDGAPPPGSYRRLPENPTHLAGELDAVSRRLPALLDTGLQLQFNGPESFTPDDECLLGESPDTAGLFVAAGFNSIGIQLAGGVGEALADWVTEGRAPGDFWEVDVARAQSFQRARRYLRERTRETLGLLYGMHWPELQPRTARGVRRSPLHDALAARGACFGVVAGWERANWFDSGFAAGATPPVDRHHWSRPNWFDAVGQEVRTTRESLGLFDQSSFSKALVVGRDAAEVLQWLSANEVDGPVGRTVYTQWLNEQGGIEADLTVLRVAEDRFWVIGYAATAHRDRAWFERRRDERFGTTVDAHWVDITSARATIGVMGPRSRELLQSLSDDDWSHEAFPFATSRAVEVGWTRLRANRLTYVGELGWELHVPSDQAPLLHEQLTRRAQELGISWCHGGYRAIGSLRMEKAYREWGHDISPADTPLEAGLGFAVRPPTASDGAAPFLGAQAIARQKEHGVRRRLVGFALDDAHSLVFGEEPVWRVEDGVAQCVGHVTSGAFGHSIDRSLALAWVEAPQGHAAIERDWLRGGSWEVEVALRRVPARLRFGAWVDPRNRKVRC